VKNRKIEIEQFTTILAKDRDLREKIGIVKES